MTHRLDDENKTLLNARDINCCWNFSPAMKMRDLVVIDDPAIDLNQWANSRGRCCRGWMGQSDAIPTDVLMGLGIGGMSPVSLFGDFLMGYEFENAFELRRTVAELANIKECYWAREMIGKTTLKYHRLITRKQSHFHQKTIG
jgi:hypothetical protein